MEDFIVRSCRIHHWFFNRFWGYVLLCKEWQLDSATQLCFAKNDQLSVKRVRRKIRISWEVDESEKLRVLKFIFGNPSCHSARRTFSSGVAESIIDSPIDSATPHCFAQNDNSILRLRFTSRRMTIRWFSSRFCDFASLRAEWQFVSVTSFNGALNDNSYLRLGFT